VKLLRLLVLDAYCEKLSIRSGEVQAAEEGAGTKAAIATSTANKKRAGDIGGRKAPSDVENSVIELRNTQRLCDTVALAWT